MLMDNTLELNNFVLLHAAGDFILVRVHPRMACRENGVATVKPFVGIASCGACWDQHDVERCARNERFMADIWAARMFAKSIARTMQTCTSLGNLHLVEGREYLVWHCNKFVVDWHRPAFMAEYGLL